MSIDEIKPLGYISQANAKKFLDGFDRRIAGTGCMICAENSDTYNFPLYTHEQILSLLQTIKNLQDEIEYLHIVRQYRPL